MIMRAEEVFDVGDYIYILHGLEESLTNPIIMINVYAARVLDTEYNTGQVVENDFKDYIAEPDAWITYINDKGKEVRRLVNESKFFIDAEKAYIWLDQNAEEEDISDEVKSHLKSAYKKYPEELL